MATCARRWTWAGAPFAVVIAAGFWPRGAGAQEDAPQSQDAAQETISTLDRVYTTEQAARGRAAYVDVCAECHALTWYSGDVVRVWGGQPLVNLYDLISTTMPESNPGSLSKKQYVDMLAYFFELNGLPPGQEELPRRASLLGRIIIEWRDEP